MKLALDIHGVINEKPDFFKQLTRAIIMASGEVHIVSGPPYEQLEKELTALAFEKYQFRMTKSGEILQNIGHYTHIFSIVDYHKELGTPMRQDSKGEWHMDHWTWDKTKADYCLKHQIDLMIDDSDTYDYFFKTPYARFKSKTKRTWHNNVDEIEK